MYYREYSLFFDAISSINVITRNSIKNWKHIKSLAQIFDEKLNFFLGCAQNKVYSCVTKILYNNRRIVAIEHHFDKYVYELFNERKEEKCGNLAIRKNANKIKKYLIRN